MADGIKITIDTAPWIRGLHAFLSYQNDPRRALRRVMRFWVSFAMKRIQKADADEIEMYYMAQRQKGARATTRRKKAQAKAHLMTTMAAWIVAAQDYPHGNRGARSGRIKAGRAAALASGGIKGRRAHDRKTRSEFVKLVERFISRRKYSAGYHRAGMVPVLKKLSASAGERLPKYRHAPGDYLEKITPDTMTLIVNNFARIIAELAPNAFDGSIEDVERLLLKWISEDIEAAKKKARLT